MWLCSAVRRGSAGAHKHCGCGAPCVSQLPALLDAARCLWRAQQSASQLSAQHNTIAQVGCVGCAVLQANCMWHILVHAALLCTVACSSNGSSEPSSSHTNGMHVCMYASVPTDQAMHGCISFCNCNDGTPLQSLPMIGIDVWAGAVCIRLHCCGLRPGGSARCGIYVPPGFPHGGAYPHQLYAQVWPGCCSGKHSSQ